MWMWRETLLQKFVKFGMNLTFFAPWLPWKRPPFWIFFNPPKVATFYGGYSYKVSWSLMKGIPKIFKSHFFVSMATTAKFVQPIPIFFGLSRSTRCGCCSYQVSSISVWRVTCYDHFCVFQFFSIMAVSMATAAILKKSTLNSTTWHMIFTRFHKVWSRHLREIERIKMCGRIMRIIIIIVKKKRRIAIHHPTAVGVM